MHIEISKTISLVLCFLLIFEQSGLAQTVSVDISGYLNGLHQTLAPDKFRPLHLRYLSYDNQTNNFKLLIDKGDYLKGLSPPSVLQDSKGTVPLEIAHETKKLMEYFFIGLTLPNDTFWVNLRPDINSRDGSQLTGELSPGSEWGHFFGSTRTVPRFNENRPQILDPLLAQTDIGRIFLEADVQLKKDTARATSPDTLEGKKYWDSLYGKAEELFGTEQIDIPTLTRPWIVPGEIIIRQTSSHPAVYIYKATLKVMLEEDYLKSNQKPVTSNQSYKFKDERLKLLNEYSTELIRELILPKLTKEINTSKRYASLRQVYYSLILAHWFKSRFSSSSLRGSAAGTDEAIFRRINSCDLTNLTSKESWNVQTYFRQYQKSFKEGEYNIRMPVYNQPGKNIRSYFSGGLNVGEAVLGEAIEAGGGSAQIGRIISGTDTISGSADINNSVIIVRLERPETTAGDTGLSAMDPVVIAMARLLVWIGENFSKRHTDEFKKELDSRTFKIAIAVAHPEQLDELMKAAKDYVREDKDNPFVRGISLFENEIRAKVLGRARQNNNLQLTRRQVLKWPIALGAGALAAKAAEILGQDEEVAQPPPQTAIKIKPKEQNRPKLNLETVLEQYQFQDDRSEERLLRYLEGTELPVTEEELLLHLAKLKKYSLSPEQAARVVRICHGWDVPVSHIIATVLMETTLMTKDEVNQHTTFEGPGQFEQTTAESLLEQLGQWGIEPQPFDKNNFEQALVLIAFSTRLNRFPKDPDAAINWARAHPRLRARAAYISAGLPAKPLSIDAMLSIATQNKDSMAAKDMQGVAEMGLFLQRVLVQEQSLKLAELHGFSTSPGNMVLALLMQLVIKFIGDSRKGINEVDENLFNQLLPAIRDDNIPPEQIEGLIRQAMEKVAQAPGLDEIKDPNVQEEIINRIKKRGQAAFLPKKEDLREKQPITFSEGKGGIDLRTLSMAIQPQEAQDAALSATTLTPAEFDAEFQRIRKMISANIVPSSQRLKGYYGSACKAQDADKQTEKVLTCVADILRLEEEQCLPTEFVLAQLISAAR